MLELQADTLCWPTLHKHCLYRNSISTLSCMCLRVFALHSHSVTYSASNKAIWLSGRVGNSQHQLQEKHQLLWKSSKVTLYALLVHTLCAFVNMLVLWVYRESDHSQTLCVVVCKAEYGDIYMYKAISSLYKPEPNNLYKTKQKMVLMYVATGQLLISMWEQNKAAHTAMG